MTRTAGFWMRAACAFALAAGLTVADGSPGESQPEPAGPTVTVIPSTGLVDFQFVRLTGSGFEPGALLEYFQCRGGAVSEADCDGYNADFIGVDAAGDVDVTIPVDARIFLPDGTEVDCRTDPAGCELGVGFMVGPDAWPEAALDFDPDAPLRPVVTATADPTTGLRDGDVVALHGENLSFREEAFAYLCAVGDTGLGERCDLDRWVRRVPDQDGSVDLALEVVQRFDTPFDVDVDCSTAPGGCEIIVSWGFFGPPDRRTSVPVSFAGESPPMSTTIPTTTTTVQRPSAPVASPAVPVRAQPRFTG
jgi:hypothetical protein